MKPITIFSILILLLTSFAVEGAQCNDYNDCLTRSVTDFLYCPISGGCGGGNGGGKTGAFPWLFNDSTTMSFNETHFNKTVLELANISASITLWENSTGEIRQKDNQDVGINRGGLNVSYSNNLTSLITIQANSSQVASCTTYTTEGATGQMSICQIGNFAINPNNTAFLNSSLIDIIGGNFVLFFEKDGSPNFGDFIIAQGNQTAGIENELFRITNEGALRFAEGSQLRLGSPGSPFVGMDQALTVTLNQTVGEGVVEFCVLDDIGNNVLFCLQSGGNDSAAYVRNSMCSFPDFLFTNASVLTNCEDMWRVAGITPFGDYFSAINRTSFGVLYSLESQKLFLHDDIGQGQALIEGDFKVVARDGLDIVLSEGTVNILDENVKEFGKMEGDNFTSFSENFNSGTLGKFILITSGKGADEWAEAVNGGCPGTGEGAFCAHAGPLGGSVPTVMESNFSTSNLQLNNLTFAINTLQMNTGGLGGLFIISLNNNSGSGFVPIYTLSLTDVLNSSITVSIPSEMDNSSKITMNYSFLSTHPTRGDVWIDLININATTLSSTLVNVTVQDGKIDFGDGICNIDMFVNETGNYMIRTCDNIIDIGNVTQLSLTITNTNATGNIEGENITARSNFILNGTAIDDWDKISALDTNIFLIDGSREMTGNFTGGNNSIRNVSEIRLGSSNGDHYIYAYDDNNPTARWLRYFSLINAWQFNTGLSATYFASGSFIQATTDIDAGGNIFADGDIYTKNAGSDAWLGNAVQADALFQMYANGNFTTNQNATIGGYVNATSYIEGDNISARSNFTLNDTSIDSWNKISGLDDNIYLKDGSREMTGDVNMSDNKLLNVSEIQMGHDGTTQSTIYFINNDDPTAEFFQFFNTVDAFTLSNDLIIAGTVAGTNGSFTKSVFAAGNLTGGNVTSNNNLVVKGLATISNNLSVNGTVGNTTKRYTWDDLNFTGDNDNSTFNQALTDSRYAQNDTNVTFENLNVTNNLNVTGKATINNLNITDIAIITNALQVGDVGGSGLNPSTTLFLLNNQVNFFTSTGNTRGLDIGIYHNPSLAKTGFSDGIAGFNVIGTGNYVGSIIRALNFGSVALNAGFQGLGNGGSSTVDALGIRVFAMDGIAATATVDNVKGVEIISTQGDTRVHGDMTTLNLLASTTTNTVDGDEIVLNVEKPTKGVNNYQQVLEGTGDGSGLWVGGVNGPRIYAEPTGGGASDTLNITASHTRFSGDVSADSFLTFSDDYDKRKYGDALQYLDDVENRISYDLNNNVIYNHGNDPDFIQKNITVACNCIIEEVCNLENITSELPNGKVFYVENQNVCNKVESCDSCIETASNLDMKIAWLRQTNYELLEKTNSLESELCKKDNSYGFC